MRVRAAPSKEDGELRDRPRAGIGRATGARVRTVEGRAGRVSSRPARDGQRDSRARCDVGREKRAGRRALNLGI